MRSAQNSETSSVHLHTCLLAGGYIALFGLAEYVLFFISAPWGVVLYFAILASLILHSNFDRSERRGGFWLALGLVPAIRIVSIVISLEELPADQSYVLAGVPVVLGIYLMARHLGYGLDDVGLNGRYIWSQVLTAVSGCGLGIVSYLLLKPEPIATGPAAGLIFPALVLLVFTGFVEELAFRGVMQRASNALGPWGWVIIAPTYALLQIGRGSLLHVLFSLVVGLYFGLVVHKTKSVVGVSLAHGLLNIALFMAIPLLLK